MKMLSLAVAAALSIGSTAAVAGDIKQKDVVSSEVAMASATMTDTNYAPQPKTGRKGFGFGW